MIASIMVCLCLGAFALVPLPWCLCLGAFALVSLPWVVRRSPPVVFAFVSSPFPCHHDRFDHGVSLPWVVRRSPPVASACLLAASQQEPMAFSLSLLAVTTHTISRHVPPITPFIARLE